MLLRTGAFETDTARAGKSLKKLQKDAEDVGKAIGLALAGAATAVAGLAISSVNSLDALKDLADATGSSVENLSALESVAKKNGGTLEDVGAILVKFNKALSDSDGKDDVSRVLKNIGLDAEKLKKLDPAEALLEVAKAMEKFGVNGESARQVQELFGKSVLKAAPFLKDLAEAGKLNATATTAQAEAAETFKKELAGVTTNIQETARAIVGDLLPAVNALFKDIRAGTLADNIFGALGLGTSTAAETLVAKLTTVNDAIAKTENQIKTIKSQGGLADVFLEKGAAATVGEAIGRLAQDDLPSLNKQLAELRAESAATEKAMIGLAKVSERVAPDAPGKPNIKPLTPKASGTDPFDALIKSAREMDAVAKASLESEDDLTDARKLAIKIATDLAAGTLKLSDARVSEIDEILKSADATQKAIELKKREADATVSAISARESFLQQQIGIVTSLREEAEAAQLQAKQFGLSTEAIVQQSIAKERAKAAALDLLAIQKGDREGNEALADTYREQAKAIRDAAKAREELLQAQIKLDTDPLTGASQAVKDYLDVVSKAGKATYDVTRQAIDGIEQIGVDALQGKNIKAQAKSLVTQLIAEFYRLQIIRPFLKSLVGEGGGLASLVQLFGGASNLQLGSTTITPQLVGEFANGSPYIPRTGLAKVHQGERVLTRKENAEGWGGGVDVQVFPAPGQSVTTERSNTGDKKLVRVLLGAVSRDLSTGGQTRRATREAVGPRPRRG